MKKPSLRVVAAGEKKQKPKTKEQLAQEADRQRFTFFMEEGKLVSEIIFERWKELRETGKKKIHAQDIMDYHTTVSLFMLSSSIASMTRMDGTSMLQALGITTANLASVAEYMSTHLERNK